MKADIAVGLSAVWTRAGGSVGVNAGVAHVGISCMSVD